MDGNRQNPGAFCPSCERFIGPADVCPYCECDSARSPVFRLLRRGALLLAAAGLALLWLLARHADMPVGRIADVGPTMNFGLVRVCGKVDRNASAVERSGRVNAISFNIDDGTGRIRIAAYGAVAQELARRKIVPSKGMKVEVTGSLNYAADGSTKIIIRRPDELRVIEAPGGRR